MEFVLIRVLLKIHDILYVLAPSTKQNFLWYGPSETDLNSWTKPFKDNSLYAICLTSFSGCSRYSLTASFRQYSPNYGSIFPEEIKSAPLICENPLWALQRRFNVCTAAYQLFFSNSYDFPIDWNWIHHLIQCNYARRSLHSHRVAVTDNIFFTAISIMRWSYKGRCKTYVVRGQAPSAFSWPWKRKNV